MSSSTPRRPSEAERAHFAAVARAMAHEKSEQIARAALARTADGIVVGLELTRWAPAVPAAQPLEDRRADDQLQLRLRWLRLQERAG